MTDTRYADGVLEFDWTGDTELVWFAYFAPYSMERHDDLVARIALQPGVTHRQLGQSLDGRAIDCLTIGTGPEAGVALCPPASRRDDGRMVDGRRARAADRRRRSGRRAALRAKATFHVVPNMNPDGSFRGHLRTNAAGVNLNREWHAPTPEKSPEVLCVRNAMDETGVDFAMDVHGDEAIPANFLAGFEGIPRWTDALGEKFYDFAPPPRRAHARFPDRAGL